MNKSGAHKAFWETYRVYSLLLLFPALLMFALSLMIYSGDDPAYYDRQTKGLITSCTDVTRRSRAISANGGPILCFLIEADYEIDGVTYTCKETWGSPREVGSAVTVSYNSAKPSSSTLIEDHVGGKKRVGALTVGSGIALIVILFPLVTGKGRKPKDKQAKPGS